MLEFRENVSLKPLHTFGMEVSARWFAEVKDMGELREAIVSGQISRCSGDGLLLLGGGSNLLFTRDFPGLCLHIRTRGISVREAEAGTVYVTAAAGEGWPEFVQWCVERDFGGLENLSLIPGNAGSSPIQNIGAYGAEVKDCLVSLEALDLLTGELRTFTAAECRFGYRDSIFKQELKGKYMIGSVTYRLKRHAEVNMGYGAVRDVLQAEGVTHPGIADVSRAICSIRRSKLPDPAVTGNAGSFFKNPTVPAAVADRLRASFPALVSYPQGGGSVKLAAGWLIEQCGWKGFREGDAGVHPAQALVLINYGSARGSDILALARRIQSSVLERFGVELEMEVNVI
jgi:UDP-N-acetylmuramate dehydrogenase